MATASDSWLKLLATLKSKFKERGCEVKESIKDESSFAEELKALCTRHNALYTRHNALCTHHNALCTRHKELTFRIQLTNSLFYAKKSILAFTKAAAVPVSDLTSDKLQNFVWGVSFAAIKYLTKNGLLSQEVVERIVRLNDIEIPFTVDANHFFEDEAIQSQLRGYYEVYIQSYFFIFFPVGERGPGLFSKRASTDSLTRDIERRNKKLKEYKKEYETRVRRKRQKQEFLQQQEVSTQQQAPAPGYPSSRNSHARFDLIDSCFEAVRRLGGSRWTDVFEVREKTTGEVYARKRIYFPRVSSSTSMEIKMRAQDEVEVMKKLRHDHIVSCLFHVEQPDWIAIFITPVADSDLAEYLESCRTQGHPVSLTSPIFQWFGSLLQALDYVHQRNVRHRDIKPRNVLIKARRPYLADFGSAVNFTEQGTSNTNSTILQGTGFYFAPETNPGEDHGRPADVFALGCVFSEMLTVANKRTLEDFSRFMRKPNEPSWAQRPYRDNLDMLKQWLENLEMLDAQMFVPQDTREKRNYLLIWVIESMIHKDKENRLTARQAWEYLLRDSGLFCTPV